MSIENLGNGQGYPTQEARLGHMPVDVVHDTVNANLEILDGVKPPQPISHSELEVLRSKIADQAAEANLLLARIH